MKNMARYLAARLISTAGLTLATVGLSFAAQQASDRVRPDSGIAHASQPGPHSGGARRVQEPRDPYTDGARGVQERGDDVY